MDVNIKDSLAAPPTVSNLRAASSEPPNLPHRDPNQDADSTLTRKRPRLDSGDRARRSRSADFAGPESNTFTADHGSPTVTPMTKNLTSPKVPSRVTINVRSQPTSSTVNHTSDDEGRKMTSIPPSDPDAIVKNIPISGQSDRLSKDADRNDSLVASTAGSSPTQNSNSSLSHDDLAALEEDLPIREPDVEAMLASFPLHIDSDTAFADSAKTVAMMLQDDLDAVLIKNLAVWIEDHLRQTAVLERFWRQIYLDEHDFWEEVAVGFLKLANRSKVVYVGDYRAVQHELGRLLNAYAALSARVAFMDIQSLDLVAEGGMEKSHNLFWRCIKALQVLLNPSSSSAVRSALQAAGLHPSLSVAKTFLNCAATTENGFELLAALARRQMAHLHTSPGLHVHLLMVIRLVPFLSLTIRQNECIDDFAEDPQSLRKLAQGVLKVFNAIDEEMQAFVNGRVLSLPTTEIRREVLQSPSTLLQLCADLDDQTAQSLLHRVVPEHSNCRRELISDVVPNAWRLKLLKKCFVKSKMEMRVFAVEAMASLLVELWQEFKVNRMEVISILADTLLREQVANYIVGVDSHPNLIARSSNIIGFFIVSGNYGPEQTDLIWNTVANSPDPRVVSATIEMINGMMNLLPQEERLHMCRKLTQLPIEAFDHTILRFWTLLFNNILSQQHLHSWIESDSRMNVFDLCIHVMRATFMGKPQAANAVAVHAEASHLLLRATHAARVEDREMIYRKLIEEINGHATLAAANADILVCMLQHAGTPKQDLEAVAALGLLRATIDDYACSVQRPQHDLPTMASQTIVLAEIGPRLNLIGLLLSKAPNVAPTDLFPLLWDVTVGRRAPNNSARDRAWGMLSELARSQQVRHAFLDMCLSQFILELAPKLYTPEFVQFLEAALRYLSAVEGGPTLNQDGSIRIPGVEMLWHVMLAVPRDSIEEPIVKRLAIAYADSTLGRMPIEAVTKTHAAVAERCAEELIKEWNIAHQATSGHTVVLSEMEVDQLSDHVAAESRFGRITLFLGLLLQHIRSNGKYTMPATQPQTIGSPIKVRYQAFSEQQTPIKTVEVGNLETRRQLYNRLRDLTGFAKFQTYLLGQRLDLLELPDQTLADWGHAASGAIMVKQSTASTLAAHDTIMDAGRGETELALLKHFQDFYQFLDLEDSFARLTYDLLATIPPYEGEPLSGLVDGSALVSDVFPRTKRYQIRYSIRCLHGRLELQLRSRSLDQSFIDGALRMLSSFATQQDLSDFDSDDFLSVALSNELVLCLYRLLNESPTQVRSLVDPPTLCERLYEILQRSANDAALYSLAGRTYPTVLELASHSNEAWQKLKDQAGLEDLHKSLLLGSPPRTPPGIMANMSGQTSLRAQIAVTIRNKVKQGLRWIAASPSDVATFYRNILEPLLPYCLKHKADSAELLQTANVVLETLIGSYFEHELKSEEKQAMLGAFLDKCLSLLGHHEHIEFVGRNEPDVVIKGLACLAETCYRALSGEAADLSMNNLIAVVSDRLLFPSFSTDSTIEQALARPTPVLDSSSRKALYELLLSACRKPSDFRQLLGVVCDVLCTDDFSRTLYHRDYFLRAPCGLIGIRNLGNTCYMNALLTQLYMNIDFRKFMLQLPVSDAKTQALVLAIQSLFAYMQEGYQKYVDASDLSRLITTFEGEAIDVTQQMDVEEFFNLKFDQTEAQILSEEGKKAFRSIYGGQMINQIKSKECEHVSERLEPYFAVQCDVKGKTNLLESLQAFVQGDVMEGDNKYKCESCDGRFVNAVKRTCLKDVPDNLIFHLKRFDFDIGTMQRSKINDLFEFPMRIDVSPYTLDHMNDPSETAHEDAFDLVGVLLHKGIAESGHYFSYIRSRPSMSGEPPRWFCFDDADVTEFSPSEIKERCYGGIIDPKELSFLDGQPMMKAYNAYMLFYQRAGTIENQEPLVSLEAQPPKVAVPAHLSAAISDRNEVLLREYTLLDPTHLTFLKELLYSLPTPHHHNQSQNHTLEDYALRTALMYLHQVFSRNRDVQAFEEFLGLIKDMIKGCHLCHLTAISTIFPSPTELDGEYSIVSDLLIRSTAGKVRQAFQDFVAATISELRADPNVSEEEYGVVKDDTEFDKAFPFLGDSSVVVRVVHAMAYHMDHLPVNTRSWDQFFGLLCSVAGLGLGEKAAILEHKIFTRCLDLIVLPYDIQSDVPRTWKLLGRLMNKRVIPYNRLLELIDLMLDNLELKAPEYLQSDDRIEDYDEEECNFPLTKDEYDMLVDRHQPEEIPFFVYRMLEVWDGSRQEQQESAARIFDKLLHSRLIQDRYLLTALNSGIEAGVNPQPYFAALKRFCYRVKERMVEGAIAIAVQATLTVDTSCIGTTLVDFFHTVAFKEAKGCLNNRMKGFEVVVGEMQNWAPTLLFCNDSEARDNTAKLVSSLLERHVPADHAGARMSQVRLRSVRVTIAHVCHNLSRLAEEGAIGKKTVRAALAVVRDCKDFLSHLSDEDRDGNDSDLTDRADTLLLHYMHWPLDDEQSDEWQSDTMMSDDDVVEISGS